MDNHLIAPLDGALECISIDSWHTKNAEDGFRFSVLGNIYQIDIVVTAPAFLTDTTQLGRPEIKSLYNTPGLGNVMRRVLICTYVFSTSELLASEVSLGYARSFRVIIRNIEEESLRIYKELTGTLVDLMPEPSFHFRSRQRERRDLVEMLIHIFNETCRNAALQVGSPFVIKDKEQGSVLLNDQRAIFNQPIRDPRSRINLANLVCHLEGKRVPARYNVRTLFPQLF